MLAKFKARGRAKYRPGEMNANERSFAAHLDRQLLENKILYYQFEPLKLKLADKTYYTPDFLVLNTEGVVELHEVKPASRGKPFAHEDAMVKLKSVAAKFPIFIFKIRWNVAGVWLEKEAICLRLGLTPSQVTRFRNIFNKEKLDASKKD